MALFTFTCVALGLPLFVASAAKIEANPVRKVVGLLQHMEMKIVAEGKKEDDLYKKFTCYCTNGMSELEARVAGVGNKIPQLEADIKSSEEALVQTKADLADAQKERSEAKQAIASASSIREKGAADFTALKVELEGYISQIKAAVAALENGMAGSFLQTTASAALKKIVLKDQNMEDDDKEVILAFLSGKDGYAPKSGEVVGILKQMFDEFGKQLKEAGDAESAAIKEYDGLVAAKKNEIDTLTTSIEAKLTKTGELGMQIVQLKADAEEQAGSLIEDKQLLADLKKGCSTKDSEYQERVTTRNQELAAIADTIKILNDDDALELFKKTLPAPSLVQIQVSAADMRARAMNTLREAQTATPEGRSRLNFLMLALRGKKIGFEKVIGMIDQLVATLQKEQKDDDGKREYCASQFDSSEDKKKALSRKLSDTDVAIKSAEESIAALAAEIAETEASVKELDRSVAEATELRKEQNDDYKALVQSDSAAKELLGFAKNRLRKFYDPKLYNPPAKKELSEQGAIERDMALVQISEHVQRKSNIEPPPETWDVYAKKSEESTGVISMIDLLIQDLDKELTEAKVEEENSQEEYDSWLADAKKDRVSLSRALKEKVATKADLQSDLLTLKTEKKATTAELMATDKFISDLHAECDWLLQYFDVRKEARAGEIDALGRAKSVLSGADYSM